MGVSFAYEALYRYRCDDTELCQVLSLEKQSQFIALLRANKSGGANSCRVRSREEEASDAVVVEEAYEEY